MAKTDSTSTLQTSSQPETEDDEVVQIAMSKPVQFSIIGSFMILLLCAFYYAQNLLLPIVVAFLSALVLSPIVRTLKRSGIHESISAFLLVVLFAGVFGLTVYSLSGPISQWIEEAPRIGQELRTKLKTLRRPMEQIDAAQKQLEDATQGTTDPRIQEVAVREPGRLSKIAQGVPNIFAGAAVTFVLLLFLLASGDMFYEARPGPSDAHRQETGLRIAYDIEQEVSRYLLTITIINFALGAVIGAGLFVLGMPNPILWGLIAALLNFVLYRCDHRHGGRLGRRDGVLSNARPCPAGAGLLHVLLGHRGPVHHPCPRRPAAADQRHRRVPGDRVLGLDMGRDRRLRRGADADRGQGLLPPHRKPVGPRNSSAHATTRSPTATGDHGYTVMRAPASCPSRCGR